jgi:hypothetical protein
MDEQDLLYINAARQDILSRNNLCWYLKRKYELKWDEACFFYEMWLKEAPIVAVVANNSEIWRVRCE